MNRFQYISIIGGVIFCASAFATTAFANPAMLPDHPGHPMKALKSPVTKQSLANDPGRSQFYGQEALKRSTKEAHEDLKLLTDSAQEKSTKQNGGDVASDSQQ